MNNKSETNLISGVVNANVDEGAINGGESSTNVDESSTNGDVYATNGGACATGSDENTAEADADKADAAKPVGAEAPAAATEVTPPAAEPEQVKFDSDIVERIIDRVVERMTSGTRKDNKAEPMADEPTGQRSSTPNFLSDIRPDFWDRL